MSDDFSDLLSHISGQSVNKQIQELAMILTRTLEIVINAVDMLEQNLNNLSNSVNQRISALEQKINMIGLNAVKPQIVKPVVQPTTAPSRKPVILDESLEEEAPPSEEYVHTPTTFSQQVTPPPPAASPPPPAAQPINPINIRQALNTELKQLFTKMRAQTE